MASVYWAFNIMAITGQLQQGTSMDDNVIAVPNMCHALFIVAGLIMLNAMFRISYLAMPHVPGDGTGFSFMLSFWYLLCLLHSGITSGRCYRFKAIRTYQYMCDLWTAHDWHMKQTPTPKWSPSWLAGEPDLLDLLEAHSRLYQNRSSQAKSFYFSVF